MARRGFIALAALALLVQVLIPQGYMVSIDQPSAGLVICTGHGPLLALDGHGKPAKAPRSSFDAPCGFGSVSAGAPPPSLAVFVAAAFAPAPAIAKQSGDLVPGRGLAAPPPPSQAPPLTLI